MASEDAAERGVAYLLMAGVNGLGAIQLYLQKNLEGPLPMETRDQVLIAEALVGAARERVRAALESMQTQPPASEPIGSVRDE